MTFERICLAVFNDRCRRFIAGTFNAENKHRWLRLLSTSRELREALGVRRAGDADFGHDRGDEFIRRHIERRIEHGDTLWNDAGAADMRDFVGVRCSIGICEPSGIERSSVDSGAAT